MGESALRCGRTSVERVAGCSLALALALLGVAPRALADAGPGVPPDDSSATGSSPSSAPSPPSPSSASGPSPSSAPGPSSAPATSDATATEARYHEAFARLARGDRSGAVAELEELTRAAPEHPLAARARALLESLGPEPADPERSPGEPSGREPRSGAARAELTLFQTFHGGVLGAEVCVMAECEEARPWVLSLMLGAGLGFGASFALSDDGVRPGLSRALSDGTIFGAANGVWVLLMAGDGDSDGQTAAASLAIGQLAGLGLGGLLYDQLQPTTGQVSLAASGGLWVPIATAELAGALGGDFDERGWGALMFVATNGGLAAGAWLASEVPSTASRALLIDGGGVLGTLAGLGLSVMVQDDEVDSQVTLAAGFAGTVGGLAVGYLLTQAWDAPAKVEAAGLRVSVTPRADGGVSALIGGRW